MSVCACAVIVAHHRWKKNKSSDPDKPHFRGENVMAFSMLPLRYKVTKITKAIFRNLSYQRNLAKHDLQPILTCRTRNSSTQNSSATASCRNFHLRWLQFATATLSYTSGTSFRFSAIISICKLYWYFRQSLNCKISQKLLKSSIFEL